MDLVKYHTKGETVKRDQKNNYGSACLFDNRTPIIIMSDHHLCSRELETMRIASAGQPKEEKTTYLCQQDIIENLGWVGCLSERAVNIMY